ncbi:MAG: NfeD family protein [Acidobacteriota bacterium]|nr:NfeD family protein [Acidobacteriota bacterium]
MFWLVIIVVCILAEMHSNAFIAVFIGAAAIIPFFLALFGVPFAAQAIIWLVLSGVMLAALRPVALKRFRSGEKPDLSAPAPTALTDLTGVVEVEVGDDVHPGRVLVKGESWRAVADGGAPIARGERIVVRRAAGTTLWVERA